MPKLSNILLIRHAEKPVDPLDPALSAAGQARAQAYVAYFQHYAIGQSLIRLDYLFAAADSRASNRSTLTLAPLSTALGMPVDARFEDMGFQQLADEILHEPKYESRNILVCWHHGQLLHLAGALGAIPESLPALWPDDVFDWLLQLSFDANGACVTCKIDQQLMDGDSTT
jgi:broad specificity phosphatase PhoE